MSELLSFNIYLHLALAIGTTASFDAAAVFLFLAELEDLVNVRLPAFLDSLLQAELDMLDDRDLYREALARGASLGVDVRPLLPGTVPEGRMPKGVGHYSVSRTERDRNFTGRTAFGSHDHCPRRPSPLRARRRR